MDSQKRLVNWKTVRRVLELVFASISIGVSAGVLDHICIEGRHTGECWFHTDHNACTFSKFSAALSLVVAGSFIVLDVLTDPKVLPKVRQIAAWIEAFIAGQITMLWFGIFVYLLAQWIRTVIDFPFIKLDKTQTVCPNNTSNECSIPENVHAAAAVLIIFCVVSFITWLSHFLLTKSTIERERARTSNPTARTLSSQSNGQLLGPQQRLSQSSEQVQEDRVSTTNSFNATPVNSPPVVVPPVVMPPVTQSAMHMQHMGQPPLYPLSHTQRTNLSGHHMIPFMDESYRSGQEAEFQGQPLSQLQMQSINVDRNPVEQAPVILPPVTGVDQTESHLLSHQVNLSLVQGMNRRTDDTTERSLSSLRARRVAQNESLGQSESSSHTRFAMLPSEHAV